MTRSIPFASNCSAVIEPHCSPPPLSPFCSFRRNRSRFPRGECMKLPEAAAVTGSLVFTAKQPVRVVFPRSCTFPWPLGSHRVEYFSLRRRRRSALTSNRECGTSWATIIDDVWQNGGGERPRNYFDERSSVKPKAQFSFVHSCNKFERQNGKLLTNLIILGMNMDTKD